MVGPPPEWSYDLEILVADDTRNVHSGQGEQRRADANTGGLLRLGWMMVGNVLLLIFAVSIFIGPSWTLTLKDGMFWGSVVMVLVLRYIDITHFGGQTAIGEPATHRDFVLYAVSVVGVSLVLWTIAQSFEVSGSR